MLLAKGEKTWPPTTPVLLRIRTEGGVHRAEEHAAARGRGRRSPRTLTDSDGLPVPVNRPTSTSVLWMIRGDGRAHVPQAVERVRAGGPGLNEAHRVGAGVERERAESGGKESPPPPIGGVPNVAVPSGLRQTSMRDPVGNRWAIRTLARPDGTSRRRAPGRRRGRTGRDEEAQHRSSAPVRTGGRTVVGPALWEENLRGRTSGNMPGRSWVRAAASGGSRPSSRPPSRASVTRGTLPALQMSRHRPRRRRRPRQPRVGRAHLPARGLAHPHRRPTAPRRSSCCAGPRSACW